MTLFRRKSQISGSLVLILALLSSCEENSTGPSEGIPFITPQEYSRVILKMIDFNKVSITHQNGLDFRSSNVAWVSVGTKDSAGFRTSMSLHSTYSPVTHVYVVRFNFVSDIDESKIEAPLTIRYYSADSSFTDVDTSIATFKFPYQSTQIVIESGHQRGYYQDVDRIGSKLYYHPLGPLGLYEYDLNTHQTRNLIDYGAGDHIAADSIYVFCDIGHNQIYRYNLLKDTIDLKFPPIAPATDISGLAAENGLVYALLFPYPKYLKVYTLDGAPIDSIPYLQDTYYITVHNSIVYSENLGVNPPQIVRFDLRTKLFLPNLVAPSNEFEGIKIYGDQMYFCDDPRAFIGAIPLSDLLPATVSQKTENSVAKGKPIRIVRDNSTQ